MRYFLLHSGGHQRRILVWKCAHLKAAIFAYRPRHRICQASTCPVESDSAMLMLESHQLLRPTLSNPHHAVTWTKMNSHQVSASSAPASTNPSTYRQRRPWLGPSRYIRPGCSVILERPIIILRCLPAPIIDEIYRA